MGIETDWNDYLEPELDGPVVYCVYSCPKCGYREVIPDTGNQPRTLNVLCPKCKTKMHEDAGS